MTTLAYLVYNPTRMFESLRSFKGLFFSVPNIVNFLVVIISFVYLAFRFSLLPPEVPLWYTLPWGRSQLAPPIYLWLIPISLLTIFVFNLFLTGFIFKNEKFLINLIMWGGLLISLLGLVTEWRIIILSIP